MTLISFIAWRTKKSWSWLSGQISPPYTRKKLIFLREPHPPPPHLIFRQASHRGWYDLGRWWHIESEYSPAVIAARIKVRTHVVPSERFDPLTIIIKWTNQVIRGHSPV
jgi:hypothetical protein